MATFKIYVYGTDQGIAQTDVFVYAVGSYDSISGSKTYDGDANNPLEITVPYDTTNSRTVRFHYTLASGATFDKWTYRVGSTSYTSTATTLTIDFVTEDIYIHADSTGGGGNWTSVYVGSDVYQNSYDSSFSIAEKQMRTIRIQFTNAGTATFTGSSNQNIYAYLSDTSTYSQANGVPTGAILISDTSESASFSMQYSVTTGVTYYLWVRYASASASGNASVTITPPSGGGGGGWSTYTPYIYNGLQWVPATAYVYDGSQWVPATPNIKS